MLKEKVTFLMPALMLGVSVCAAVETAPATAKEIGPTPDYTVRLVNAGRQEELRSADKEISRANKLFVSGEYKNAAEIYNAIAERLKKFSGEVFVKKREYCLQRIEDCYIKDAEKAMVLADDSISVGDFEKAIALCKEAMLYCPGKKDELEKKVAFYEKRRNAAVIREQRDINTLQPAYAADNYKVDLLIEQGRGLVRREEYMKAKRCFEEVLLVDPYNDTAMQNLLAVNTLIQKAAKLRANATQKRYTAMNIWSGAVPVAAETQESEENNIDSPVDKEDGSNSVEDKLKKIKIPKVQFQEQEFEEITDFLQREAKRHDEAINFILKPNPNPDPNLPKDVKELSKTDVSLYDLLKELQNVHKVLTFRVEKNVVFIAAAGVPLEKNVIKMWHRILPTGVDEDKLKEYLASDNIVFDQNIGQWIKYNTKDSLVIARHTPDTLAKIEKALDELGNDEPDMVQIMFKFLEVKQNDLDELAFSWQYSRTGNNVQVADAGNSLLRHYSYGELKEGEKPERWAGTFGSDSVDDANVYFSWKDHKNKIDFQLYALDWADNKSILYAPRFTTIGGQTVSIDISTKRHFTEEWEYIDEDTQGKYHFTGAFMPDLEQEESVGLKPFDVTPQINGEHVTMKLNLSIRQFMGYTEYIIDGGKDDKEKITKPIFNDRDISTNVTVKDCSTVYIGGVVTDVTSTIDDKVPILGDIPLIGRLFQAKYTKSEKVNLMVFVSCRIIKPDGSLRFPENATQNGLPIFSNNM